MKNLEHQEQLEKIVSSFSDGKPLEHIASKNKITLEAVQAYLMEFKENSKKNTNAYTQDFKEVVALRIDNGIAKLVVSKELGLSPVTVKKFYDKFSGKNTKRELSEQLYTRIDGEHWKEICPTCGSKKNNKVEEDTTYCMDCGSEHTYCVEYTSPDTEETVDNYAEAVERWGENKVRSTCFVLKLNYEFMEE